MTGMLLDVAFGLTGLILMGGVYIVIPVVIVLIVVIIINSFKK